MEEIKRFFDLFLLRAYLEWLVDLWPSSVLTLCWLSLSLCAVVDSKLANRSLSALPTMLPQANALKSFSWADTVPCYSLGLLCCRLTVMALPSATSPTSHRGLLTGQGDGSLAVVLHPLSKHSRSLTWHFPLVPISWHSYLWPLTFDVHWLTSCLFFLFFTFWLDRNISSYSFSHFSSFFCYFPPLLFTTFDFNKWFVHSSYFLPQLPVVFIPLFSLNILFNQRRPLVSPSCFTF